LSVTSHSSSPGKRLRAAVEEQTIQAPGAFNALVARLVERQGFGAVYLSGAAFSAGSLALPDVGLFTLTELAAETTRIARAVKIPVIVDADTGFGEAVNVERTVRELEAAGAAAIQLEDQRLPKRCGHLSGKSLVSTDEMCAKLRAAEAARRDAELVIIARSSRGPTPAGLFRWTRRSRGQRRILWPGPTGSFPRRSKAGTSSTA
jgi:methylisocitrate lyase